VSKELARHFPAAPFVLLESFDPERSRRSFLFQKPRRTIAAWRLCDVRPALESIEAAVGAEGLHAAGFLAYEAAAAFDPAMKTHAPTPSLPLLWFGLFQERLAVAPGSIGGEGCDGREAVADPAWTPCLSRQAYDRTIERIHQYEKAGETYQVNYTFRLRSPWTGNAFAFYRRLCKAQRAGYCAYVDLGDGGKILSASPELFFERRGANLTVRPMKGTGSRGRSWQEDERCLRILSESAKDRSENLMIVDLLRNDLGRIAEPGSVGVSKLFEIERYETLLQMTSTIHSKLKKSVDLWTLFSALFPCGSVTGAPKIRTMEIIAECEDWPRGIYTGAIGFLSPNDEAVFNVAIRTLWIDEAAETVEFGVGGGVTFDSTAEGEYQECLTKARFLTEVRPKFDLLETLLLHEGRYRLLERHLNRLGESARYFHYPCDEVEIRAALEKTRSGLNEGAYRVRLRVSSSGEIRCEAARLKEPDSEGEYRVALCPEPIDSRDPFLFHKTTHRAVYERSRALRPDVDDVILQNERGEITESTIANVAVVSGGVWYTPPVECGLLVGTERQDRLDRGTLQERVLRPEDIQRAEAVYLFNSVRGAWRVRVVP